ncbi:hypothetical protein R9C00_01665 [Flammeovirgaceae bacterium SG7u.111]|nr:hypothetical protein [Flammeovirgaceae bacterium SG7u.132]WPO36149.1 hypothetical protein R9C00_01665 [Flammeovirgaceae bacterium SG7u.111]
MKYIYSILLMLLLASVSFAQHNYFSGISYDVAVPMGNTADYIDKTSFRGFGLEFRKYVKEHITVGGTASWQVLDQVRREESYEVNNVVLTGNQRRFLNFFPILANAHYYFGEREDEEGNAKFLPFAGINAGVIYSIQRTELGTLEEEKSAWQPTLAPEAGFFLPINNYLNIMVSAKYNYSVGMGDMEQQSFIGLRLGYYGYF